MYSIQVHTDGTRKLYKKTKTRKTNMSPISLENINLIRPNKVNVHKILTKSNYLHYQTRTPKSTYLLGEIPTELLYDHVTKH